MKILKNAKVIRGGATASKGVVENTVVIAGAAPPDVWLAITLDLASKGGGTTHMELRIGKTDFESLLKDVAENVPESATVLMKCALIGVHKNLELLQKARGSDESEQVKRTRR